MVVALFGRTACALCAAVSILLALAGAGGASEHVGELYRASTIITGTQEHEKQRGFAASLERVLVKLSGDPDLAGSPKVVGLAVRAAEFVQDYELRDRMAGIPVHDEQGTRDRPHILTVEFARAKVDRALRELGHEPWLDRPPITLAVSIDNGTQQFMLGEGAEAGAAQREALTQTGAELGLTIDFPGQAALARVAGDTPLSWADRERLEDARRELGAKVLLAGTLTWDEKALRWSSTWRLLTEESLERWGAGGVSFDTVFRSTLEKAMQVLSSRARR
ncbi:DUF2066 domain-containing protein [Chelativorans sp.]|uniref:DUF2066 domain-containing protein n=1 Tax=Chelativorans sp. TaxID=2203393 RepID=UPI002810CE5B|nr:DUF2066 domain-containing protein [Chelativorans sp.]